VKRLIPQSDLDAAQIAVDAARAGVTAQQATVEQTQAAVRQSEASVDQTEVNVAHTIITAPIDGIVIQRSVDVGQTVAASLQSPTLFVIAADLTTLQVSADIDEADIASADSPDRLGASSGLHGPPARERGSGRCGFVAGGLIGMFAGSPVRSTDHYLELEYMLPDGSVGALSFRLHKENQQEIIDAMPAATGIEK